MTSLDDRVRTALGRSASEVETPDVDRALAGAKRRATSRRHRHVALASAAVVAVAVVGGFIAVRSGDKPARVATATTTSAPLRPPPGTASIMARCPDHYRFGFVPEGWTETSPGVIAGPSGTAKLTVVGTSTANQFVGPSKIVGFAAVHRTNGGDVHEVRLDDSDGRLHTDPSCGGELAVVTSGLSQDDVSKVVVYVEPIITAADRRQFRAVWPSSDLEQVVALDSISVASDQRRVASAFAQQSGWSNPTVTDLEPSEDGLNGAKVAVAGTGGEPALLLELVSVPATGWWAVLHASTFTTASDFALSVSITSDPEQRDTVASSFGDAASARLVINDDYPVVDLTTEQMPPMWSFEVGPHPEVPGALFVTWRDATGNVVALHATSLPPGDFAAG
jgi:hypothetical protein